MERKSNTLLDLIKGMVVGIANIIPGVSGGTMMVAMGIYDRLIWSITHLFPTGKNPCPFCFRCSLAPRWPLRLCPRSLSTC